MSAQNRYTCEQLLQQTARISWSELEPHFARGAVIAVDADVDLVEVATAFANDDKARVATWLQNGTVEPLQARRGRRWSQGDPQLWGVVVAPWVLVQERKA